MFRQNNFVSSLISKASIPIVEGWYIFCYPLPVYRKNVSIPISYRIRAYNLFPTKLRQASLKGQVTLVLNVSIKICKTKMNLCTVPHDRFKISQYPRLTSVTNYSQKFCLNACKSETIHISNDTFCWDHCMPSVHCSDLQTCYVCAVWIMV